MNRLLTFLVTVIACCSTVEAQQQTNVEFFNDYGDGTVQTFVSESDQTFLGVELVLVASGSGADVTIQIRDLLADGTLSPNILATGVFPSSDIPLSGEVFQTILFDNPLDVELGEDFGLVINQFDSGPTGFTNYGAANGDSYDEGFLGVEIQDEIFNINPDSDLAFQFVSVPASVPEPSSGIAMMLCVSLLVARRNRKLG